MPGDSFSNQHRRKMPDQRLGRPLQPAQQLGEDLRLLGGLLDGSLRLLPHLGGSMGEEGGSNVLCIRSLVYLILIGQTGL